MFIIKELDDGQVIKDELSNLTHHQILSVANQLLRENTKQSKNTYYFLIQYQHEKFHESSPLLVA